jgi:hypothetical protein
MITWMISQFFQPRTVTVVPSGQALPQQATGAPQRPFLQPAVQQTNLFREGVGASDPCLLTPQAIQLANQFNPSFFISSVGTSCAQWLSLGYNLKTQIMIGYYNGQGARLDASCPILLPFVSSNPAMPTIAGSGQVALPWPTVAWLVSGSITAVDRYCALQQSRSTVVSMVPSPTYAPPTNVPYKP